MIKKKKKEKVEKLEIVESKKELDTKKKVKEKKEKKKLNINLKDVFKSILRFVWSHKIFIIINILFLVLTILISTKKLLFGIAVIVMWVMFIALYIIGGKFLGKKNGPMNEEEMKKYKKRKRKLFKFIFNFILLMILLFLIVAIVFSIYIVVNAPDFDPENLYRAESSIIYDRNGNQIAKIGLEKRKKVTYDDLPQVLVDAIIATEDSRYYQHNGFDLPRFTRAAAGQVINKITGRGNAGGGSTISMQVVKNNFTDTEQTVTRKFTDIYISIFKLEKNYSKEEILEYYVNTPFLGNSSYGVEQACQSYFGNSRIIPSTFCL